VHERDVGVLYTERLLEVTQRVDPERFLDGLPLASVEVAEVDIAATGVGEQQRAVQPWPQLVERLKGDRL
jgi:hypothetical protein